MCLAVILRSNALFRYVQVIRTSHGLDLHCDVVSPAEVKSYSVLHQSLEGDPFPCMAAAERPSHTHTRARASEHTHTHKKHTCARAHTHKAHTHTRAHAHTHTRTNAHTHTH